MCVCVCVCVCVRERERERVRAKGLFVNLTRSVQFTPTINAGEFKSC